MVIALRSLAPLSRSLVFFRPAGTEIGSIRGDPGSVGVKCLRPVLRCREIDFDMNTSSVVDGRIDTEECWQNLKTMSSYDTKPILSSFFYGARSDVKEEEKCGCGFWMRWSDGIWGPGCFQ